MPSKEGEKSKAFLSFRRNKEKITSKNPRQSSSTSSGTKNRTDAGKTSNHSKSRKNNNVIVSKPLSSEKSKRRLTKTATHEVHWYPFYVSVAHSPPDDYYADTSKEDLWWSREFLEQRMFESFDGQMMDEEDREHKHRLLQMGQDVVPTRRRSHDSVVGIAGNIKNLRWYPGDVAGEVACKDDGKVTNEQLWWSDDDIISFMQREASTKDGSLRFHRWGVLIPTDKIIKSFCYNDDLSGTDHIFEDNTDESEEIKPFSCSDNELEQEYENDHDGVNAHQTTATSINSAQALEKDQMSTTVQQLVDTDNEDRLHVESVKEVRKNIAHGRVIDAAEQKKDNNQKKNEQSNEVSEDYDDDELAKHERNILEQTQEYVRQYTELVKNGENVDGMLTPTQVIAAAQRVLQRSMNAQVQDQRTQLQPVQDNNTADKHKILAHTEAYVQQYNELARIGINLDGMVTPEEAIAATQALLREDSQLPHQRMNQVPLHGETLPIARHELNQFGVSEHLHADIRPNYQAHAPINTYHRANPYIVHQNQMPLSHYIHPGPMVTHFQPNYHMMIDQSYPGMHHPPHYHYNHTDIVHGGHFVSSIGANEFHESRYGNQFHESFYPPNPNSGSRNVFGSDEVKSLTHNDLYPAHIDPLDRRFWQRQNPPLKSSLKRGTKSQSSQNVSWKKGYVTYVVESTYMISSPQDMWWTGVELQRIEMENQRELQTRESARLFDHECGLVFDHIIDECGVFQDRRRNPLGDLSALWNPMNLRRFLSPNLIQGLMNGHRGLEMGGLQGRREKTVEQYNVVFDYLANNQVKKNKQTLGLAEIASSATLCDRVFAHLMGLADELIIHSLLDAQ